jgi:hypothetical protein
MKNTVRFIEHKWKRKCIITPQEGCLIPIALSLADRLCGLVVRVLGYKSGGPGSIPGTTRKKK